MSIQYPFLEPSFEINWDKLSHETIVSDITKALETAQSGIKAIEDLDNSEVSYKTTFAALESALETISTPWGKVHTLESLCNSEELRGPFGEMLPKVSVFFAGIPLNPKLYSVLASLKNKPEYETLSVVQKRYVNETLTDFEESGADLPEEKRNRLQEIETELSKVCKNFADNVLDSTNAWELIIDDKDELKGLPDSFVEAARLDALEKGYGSESEPKYRFSLQMPSLDPALRFIDSDELKKTIYTGFTTIGDGEKFDNEANIKAILKLRAEKARILGKDQFPDVVLQRRMAKSGANALKFVEDLFAKTKPFFDKECNELAEFRAEKTGEPLRDLYPWESKYWNEKLKQERFAFDEEQLRPYFPVDSVLAGMFGLVEKIFSIKVTERTENKPPVWHESVKYYDVYDANDDRHLGSFYTDWFPRESKRSGAWMAPLITGEFDDTGKRSPHLGYICGNFNKPLGDKPALLTHREVETVFHEFGHLIHHLLSDVEVKSLSGTDVAWDFVELPSQIMENWCWERSSLDLFAKHFETGDTIPDALFNKLKASRTYSSAAMQMRQLCFGKMDLEMHLRPDNFAEGSLRDKIIEVLEGYQPPSPVKPHTIEKGFLHLFSSSVGYASGYYSYKWAEVLDADAFTKFSSTDVMSNDTGMAFRSEILAKGNSEPPEDLFKNFMGRDPDPQALMTRLGLVS